MSRSLPYTIPGGQQVQFRPTTIAGRGQGDAVVEGSGSIRSLGYVAGSAGWRLDGDGNLEANAGVFRGSLSADSVVIGINGTLGDGLGDRIPPGGAAADIVTNSTTITGGNIATGRIRSAGFSWNDADRFSTTGLMVDLDAGELIAPSFRLDSDGNAFFSGIVEGGVLRTKDNATRRTQLAADHADEIRFYHDATAYSLLGAYPSGSTNGLKLLSHPTADVARVFIIEDQVSVYGVNNLNVLKAGLTAGGAVNAGRFYSDAGVATQPAYALGAQATENADTGLYLSATNEASLSANGFQIARFGTQSSDIFFASNLVRRLALQSDGNMVIYDGANTALWSAGTAVSDARLKTNVRDFHHGLALVDQLRPVDYEWSEETGFADDPLFPYERGERQVGLLAQDVTALLPQATRQVKSGTGTIWHLDKAELVPVLVSAVQELAARVRFLEERGA